MFNINYQLIVDNSKLILSPKVMSELSSCELK